MIADIQAIEDLWRTLHSSTLDRAQRIEKDKIKFVHYTSAASALSIIQNGSFWMRSPAEMNDFSEVHHGFDKIFEAWNQTTAGKRFEKLLEEISPTLPERLRNELEDYRYDLIHGSYMISVSEHAGPDAVNEETLGRLSMWRAYGGSTNVAIVMNNEPFLGPISANGAFTTPVLYADTDTFKEEFQEFVAVLERRSTQLKQLDDDIVEELLNLRLMTAALSTKHPGFSEEREWRVIYTNLVPLEAQGTSEIVVETEVISGVPQRVAKLSLSQPNKASPSDLTIDKLFDKIIIGPTHSGVTIAHALMDALHEAGVQNPADRVIISDIPLRN